MLCGGDGIILNDNEVGCIVGTFDDVPWLRC